MLTTPNTFLSFICLDFFVHHLPRSKGEADQHVVPQILLLPLLVDRSDISFLSVLGTPFAPLIAVIFQG